MPMPAQLRLECIALCATLVLVQGTVCPQSRVDVVVVNSPDTANQNSVALSQPHGLAGINDTVYVLNQGAVNPANFITRFTEDIAAVGSVDVLPSVISTPAFPSLSGPPMGYIYRLSPLSTDNNPGFALLTFEQSYGPSQPLLWAIMNNTGYGQMTQNKSCWRHGGKGLALDTARNIAWVGFERATDSNSTGGSVVKMNVDGNRVLGCETVEDPQNVMGQITDAALDRRSGCAYFSNSKGLASGNAGRPAVFSVCPAPTPPVAQPVRLTVDGTPGNDMLTNVVAMDIEEIDGDACYQCVKYAGGEACLSRCKTCGSSCTSCVSDTGDIACADLCTSCNDAQRQLLLVTKEITTQSSVTNAALWVAPVAGGEAVRMATNENLNGATGVLASHVNAGVAWVVTSSSQLVFVCTQASCGCAARGGAPLVLIACMTAVGVLLVGFGSFWLRKRIDARKRLGHNDLQAPLLDSATRSRSALEMTSGGSDLSKLLDAHGRQSLAIDLSDIEYHPNDILGHGAQGRVYKARYMGMHVALKEMLFGGMASNKEARDSVVRAFAREVDLLSGLHHENVVRLMGVSRSSACCYLVTELCDCSLESVVSKAGGLGGDDNRARWLLYAQEIGCAMAFLHAKGVIHRDLKDANVLLDFNGKCKVADFGVSSIGDKLSEGAPMTATMTRGAGTPLFMAPEVMTGNAGEESSRYSGLVDVYSYGILLWRMWTGKRPFTELSGNILLLLNHIVGGGRPSLPASMPPCVCQLVQSCWHEEPDKRPEFMEINQILAGWGDGERFDVVSSTESGSTLPRITIAAPHLDESEEIVAIKSWDKGL